MKKVALKLFILFVTVFIINSVLHNLLIPYDWGDDVLQTKNEYFDANRSEFNTVFIGGSLVYRHVACQIFDSINHQNGIHTKSFNYGVDGNQHVKQLILVNKLLDKDKGDLDYLFLSLSSTAHFDPWNLHTIKIVTWMDFPSLLYAIKIALNIDESLKQRLIIVYRATINWLENKFNAGFAIPLIKYKVKDEKRYVTKKMIDLHLGEKNDGFRPYYFDPSVDTNTLSVNDKFLYKSNVMFYEDTVFMDSLMENYYVDLSNYDSESAHLNKVILKRYEKLIMRTEKMGIKLVAVIPPRSILLYSKLLPIYEALPENNKIHLGDPNEYPAFYADENTFNYWHMNKSGAIAYTKELSKEFDKITE